MQEGLDLGQPAGEEASVGADRVATERDRSRLVDVLPEEGQGLLPRIVEVDRRGADGVGQAAVAVHLHDDRVHLGEFGIGLVDHQVGSLGDDVQVVVGEQRGDLDDDMARRVETGHLQVHPGQHDPRLYVLTRSSA